MSNSTFKKTAVIVGGSGLIGSHLIPLLVDDGYRLKLLTRRPENVKSTNSKIDVIKWNGELNDDLVGALENTDVVINLAGHNIATLWTKRNRDRILSSRIHTTRSIAKAILMCKNPPKAFVQASAVGIYPYDSIDVLTEHSQAGNGFLSQLVSGWEQEALASSNSTRVVLIRTGIVLAKSGGFFPKIAKTVRLFLGTIFGKGKQIVPWIHISDHVRAVKFLIGKTDAVGAFNLTAPSFSSYSDIVNEVAKYYRRPVLFKVPSFLLRLLPGKMGDEVFLANQPVKPERLIGLGFAWSFPTLDKAIRNLLDK
jgi:hypothetical protein